MIRIRYRKFNIYIYEPNESKKYKNKEHLMVMLSKELQLGNAYSIDFKNVDNEDKKYISKRILDEQISKYEKEHNCKLGVLV